MRSDTSMHFSDDWFDYKQLDRFTSKLDDLDMIEHYYDHKYNEKYRYKFDAKLDVQRRINSSMNHSTKC